MKGRALLIFRGTATSGEAGVPIALTSFYRVPVFARWLYALRHAGYRDVAVLAPPEALKALRERLGDGGGLGLNITYLEGEDPGADGYDLIVEGDYLVAPEAFRSFCSGSYAAALCGGQEILIRPPLRNRASTVSLDELSEPHHRPACAYAGNVAEAKSLIVKWAGKRLHLFSRLNAPFEDLIVKAVGGAGWVTPNRVTVLVSAVAAAAAALLLKGLFLQGALLAYFAGILDGVDGKLARTRGILTRVGHLEHSIDALFEQTIYAALALGLFLGGYGAQAVILGAALLVVDSFARHIYNNFSSIAGKPLKEYSRFDEKFAVLDGRRNFYLFYAIIFSLLGAPILALVASLTHASVTAGVYLIRSIQHLSRLDAEEGTKNFLKLCTR
ncbi:MAG: CDP-alcohol phosphatidyltransferase family protein [Infirmifilum sp.]